MFACPSKSCARGLLGRIQSSDPDRPIDPSGSIQAHLLALLNTRTLHSELDPQQGALLLDEIVHQAPMGLQALSKRIKNLITRFEPRLKRLNVQAKVTGAVPLIHVRVCAWHCEPPQRPFHVDLELRANGRFSLT